MTLIDKLKVPEFDRELIRKYLEAKGCVRDASFVNGEQAALHQHSLLTKEIEKLHKVIKLAVEQRDNHSAAYSCDGVEHRVYIERDNKELLSIIEGV